MSGDEKGYRENKAKVRAKVLSELTSERSKGVLHVEGRASAKGLRQESTEWASRTVRPGWLKQSNPGVTSLEIRSESSEGLARRGGCKALQWFLAFTLSETVSHWTAFSREVGCSYLYFGSDVSAAARTDSRRQSQQQGDGLGHYCNDPGGQAGALIRWQNVISGISSWRSGWQELAQWEESSRILQRFWPERWEGWLYHELSEEGHGGARIGRKISGVFRVYDI